MTISWIVPGEPVGHANVTYRSKFLSPAGKRAARWKKDVVVCLMQQHPGVDIPKPTMKAPVWVHVICWFGGNRHPDCGNVQKAACDALFPRHAGGDKHTGGGFEPPRYDKAKPRTEVRVEWHS